MIILFAWAIFLVIVIVIAIILCKNEEVVESPIQQKTRKCDKIYIYKEIAIDANPIIPLIPGSIVEIPLLEEDIQFTAPIPFDETGTVQCASRDPWMYGTSGNQMIKINFQTNQVVVVGNTGQEFYDIAFDDRGRMIGTLFTNFWEIDLQTAARSFLGNSTANVNSLCGYHNGKLYGISFGNLYEIDKDTLTATILRSGVAALGDCLFYNGYFYWSTFPSRLFRIYIGDDPSLLATNPIEDLGPCDPFLYALAVWECGLYGMALRDWYEIDPETAAEGPRTTVPPFGFNFIQGGAKFDEAALSGSYLVSIETIDENAFPINLSFNQPTVVYFQDPLFPYISAIAVAGSSFTIDVGYTLTNIVDMNFHPA